MKDFQQIEWDARLDDRCRTLARLALEEDVAGGVDHTVAATVPAEAMGRASVMSRDAGVAAGLRALPTILEVFGGKVDFTAEAQDGDAFEAGMVLATLKGRVRDMLTVERTLLNFLAKLAGIATHTRQYVRAVEGTQVKIYDTRKTTPGWRLLEKYAVRCGGGHNHRAGLHEAILIKDNHIASFVAAQRETQAAAQGPLLADLISATRTYAQSASAAAGQSPLLVEIEVDSLEQLRDALVRRPDLVLLDNMAPATLQEAVAIRNERAPQVELEASGGVRLDTIRAIAQAGIERISVGGLTHHASWLDVGLDWTPGK